MDLNKIEELIKVLEDSRAEEISVRKGEFAIHVKKGRKTKSARPAPNAKTASESAAMATAESASTEKHVLAPMVGVFRVAGDPIKIGANVTAGQVVGAIESMKLLNDVVSDLTGVVTGVFVDDGMPAEYGQALYAVEEA